MEKDRSQLQDECVKLRQELEEVKGSRDQAIAEKEEATRQAKEHQDALDQAMASACKREEELLAEATSREEQLTNNIVPLADTLSGALGIPRDLEGRLRVSHLSDVLGEVEDYGARLNQLMVDARNTLFSMYEKMFPRAQPPQGLHALVNFFNADHDPLGKYSKAQTVCGAKTALTLAIAHGIQGDLDKAMSEIPKGVNGKEVDLTPFARRARGLSKKLAALV